jgi:LysM repeat protein
MKTVTLLILLCPLFLFAQSKPDLSRKNQNLHVVQAKETLYSLLKKYNTSKLEFLELNPYFKEEEGLKIGQKLYFKALVNSSQTATSSKSALPRVLKTYDKPGDFHTVKEKETIFSIVKMYGISIDTFVRANALENNIIKPGQKLLVNRSRLAAIEKEIQIRNEPELVPIPKGKKFTEQGIAEVVPTKNRTRKFLALHRTAPKGSVVKITNEANGEFIHAKVIGKLNHKGKDEGVLIKLSPLAFYKLKPKDSKLRAKVEFYKGI